MPVKSDEDSTPAVGSLGESIEAASESAGDEVAPEAAAAEAASEEQLRTKEDEEGDASAVPSDDTAAPVPVPATVVADTAPAIDIPSGEEEPPAVADATSRSLEPTSEAAAAVDDVAMAA
ncbi:unnamed protein product, partial [Scytosiphon promiscuus]